MYSGQEEHPVLQPLDEAVAADHCEALATFEKLIYRDQFLVTLVEVLEGQRQVRHTKHLHISNIFTFQTYFFNILTFQTS